VRPNISAAAVYSGRAPSADAQNTATLFLKSRSVMH